MAVTSGDLALYKPAIDEQGWGTNVNGNFDTIDTAVTARSVPAGSVFMTARTTAPTGYLLCDGSAISRVTYATLFTAISTTFGVGDGATTFNIPDTRGRSPLGAGTGSGLTARTLAANVGTETHTLVTGELPVHTHTPTDSGHTHAQRVYTSTAGGSSPGIEIDLTPFQAGVTNLGNSLTTASSTTGITIGNAGSGTAHANMHPCVVFNYMIKT